MTVVFLLHSVNSDFAVVNLIRNIHGSFVWFYVFAMLMCFFNGFVLIMDAVVIVYALKFKDDPHLYNLSNCLPSHSILNPAPCLC